MRELQKQRGACGTSQKFSRSGAKQNWLVSLGVNSVAVVAMCEIEIVLALKLRTLYAGCGAEWERGSVQGPP